MVTPAHPLMAWLPGIPRRRFNVFTGSNTASEWWTMLRAWLSASPEDPAVTDEYERAFAGQCSAGHAISFGSGRMSLFAILEALGIGGGDEVIIPAFTCVVVPNAILYRGARPVYVDIDHQSFNIDVSQIEAAITPRTRALYAQHTFGVTCDVDAIRSVATRHGLPVIEDAAHALGASYKGRPVGSLTEVAFFSTDHSKLINTHLGGMVVTNSAALAERLRTVQANAPYLDRANQRRLMRSFLVEFVCFSPGVFWIGRLVHAIAARLGLLFYFSDELKTKKPTDYPYPCRLSATQATLGLSQLRNLQDNLTHRRQIAGWLENKIKWYGFDAAQMGEASWLRYSFLVRDRPAFESAFAKNFDLGIWFTSVLGERTHDFRAVGYEPGSCPIAEYVSQHIVNFPTHLRIPLDVIQREVDRNWIRLQADVFPTTPYAQNLPSGLAANRVH